MAPEEADQCDVEGAPADSDGKGGSSDEESATSSFKEDGGDHENLSPARLKQFGKEADGVSIKELAATSLKEHEGDHEHLSPAELKQCGNEAYQRQDFRLAVDLWNKSLRAHVDGMRVGTGPGCAASPLSAESAALERSLYLNLAQGYLRLGEHDRALKACKVVLLEHPRETKAHFRGAEACLAMERYDEAIKWASALMEVDPSSSDGPRLLRRAREGRRAEAKRQRAVAERMCKATEGFSEDRPAPRPKPAVDDQVRSRMLELDPKHMAASPDIAEQAALKARQRLERQHGAEGPPANCPGPTTGESDLDVFRARAMAKVSRYNAHTDKLRKRTDAAQRSVTLQCLRDGQTRSEIAAFSERWLDELKLAQAVPMEDHAANPQEETLAEDDPQGESPAEDVSPTLMTLVTQSSSPERLNTNVNDMD